MLKRFLLGKLLMKTLDMVIKACSNLYIGISSTALVLSGHFPK